MKYTVEILNNCICWFKEGTSIRHREDGPAVEFNNGDKLWYKDNLPHREGGPAEEYVDGTKVWTINGRRHREDGPAVERSNGIKEWYFKGRKVNCNSLEEFLENIRTSCHNKVVEIDNRKYRLVEILK